MTNYFKPLATLLIALSLGLFACAENADTVKFEVSSDMDRIIECEEFAAASFEEQETMMRLASPEVLNLIRDCTYTASPLPAPQNFDFELEFSDVSTPTFAECLFDFTWDEPEASLEVMGYRVTFKTDAMGYWQSVDIQGEIWTSSLIAKNDVPYMDVYVKAQYINGRFGEATPLRRVFCDPADYNPPLAAPTNFRFTEDINPPDYTFTFLWDAPETSRPIFGYRVYRENNNSGYWNEIDLTATSYTFMLFDKDPWDSYYECSTVKVAAIYSEDGYLTGEESDAMTVCTWPF